MEQFKLSAVKQQVISNFSSLTYVIGCSLQVDNVEFQLYLNQLLKDMLLNITGDEELIEEDIDTTEEEE